MDADEALSPDLIRSIREARDKGLTGAYACDRLTNYCGTWVRHGGWYPDTKVRLFPKDGARWEGAHVHEVLRLADTRTPTRLQGDLLHYSYYSVADHKERIERYSSLHAQAMFEAGKRAGIVKIWLSPIVKFIQGYVFQLGLLDGMAGWNIAWFSARAVHLKYVKLQALSRGINSSKAYHP
jgi:(heptosyl)LPS beta-1,4-glucosyltransferase